MELYGLIGVVTYSTVALVVGLRLLRLARRTGEWPERLIGAAFVAGSTFGYPMLVAADRLRTLVPDPALMLSVAGWAGLVLAASCLLAFWQRVYHPDRPAARWAVALGSAFLLSCLFGLVFAIAPGAPAAESFWFLPALTGQGAAYALNGWASARYWRKLRRRLALGLVDAVVVNRIALWSTAAWAVTLQYSYSIVRMLVTGSSTVDGLGAALVSSLGLIAAGTMLMAFFPPRSYLVWLERSSAGATG
jgi:hypothetical protein